MQNKYISQDVYNYITCLNDENINRRIHFCSLYKPNTITNNCQSHKKVYELKPGTIHMGQLLLNTIAFNKHKKSINW